MSEKKNLIILMLFFLILIGNTGCFLQPVNRVDCKFYIVDYDAPAMRLGEPVEAELWRKDSDTGKWECIGTGEIPAGAYIKGRKPEHEDIEDILNEERNK